MFMGHIFIARYILKHTPHMLEIENILMEHELICYCNYLSLWNTLITRGEALIIDSVQPVIL